MTANTVQIMHSTMSTPKINLCQFRASGKEIKYNQAIRKQMTMRTNVRLEEYQKLSKKFMEKKPAIAPKIKVNDKLDIQAYNSHSPPLKIMMAMDYVQKFTTTTTINPYLSAPTANTGTHHTWAQPLEQNRPEHFMLAPYCYGA